MRTSDIRLANYVNQVMDEINDLASELYEALMDNETNDVNTACNKLEYRIRDIKKSYLKNENAGL